MNLPKGLRDRFGVEHAVFAERLRDPRQVGEQPIDS
jgi:hypothetical protein